MTRSLKTIALDLVNEWQEAMTNLIHEHDVAIECSIEEEVTPRVNALIDEITEANERIIRILQWYKEKAEALQRYGSMKPLQAVAMEAVVTELMIDNGHRGAVALEEYL